MNKNLYKRKNVLQLFVFLVIIVSKVFSEKFEKTTSCIFRSDSGVQSFEFVCEPNKTSREFFDNGDPIYCGGSYYKERRHKVGFQNCYLKQLPVIFKWYRAVQLLNVSSTGLESVRSRNFDYADNLLVFIASHNELTEIPPSLFVDSKNITEVNFSFNKINRIDPMAFDSENKITSLDLSNNLINQIENGTFVKLHRLEILDLSYNLIDDIQLGWLDELKNLNTLYLNNNQLKQLQCSTLSNLMNLEILHLTKNNLEEFDSTCVESEKTFTLFIEDNPLMNLTLSQNVSGIHASANQIQRIFVMLGLENMTVFNVSKNRIENVPEVLSKMSSRLRYLDVSDSMIGKLNISTFAKFDNLQHLFLRNTSLSNIQYGTFDHQRKLLSLDLSYNNLKQIKFGMLPSFVMLQSLYLDGNMLKNLDNLTKVKFPSLESISIGKNNFDCEYLSGIHSLLVKEKISMFSKTSILDIPNDQTHIDGVDCYHNSLPSTEIPEIVQTTEGNEILANLTAGITDATTTNSDTNSMWKIELLLTCIAVVLMCLLIVLLAKSFVLAMKNIRLAQRNVSEHVQYRSKAEEQSLI